MDAQEIKESDNPREEGNWVQVASLKIATSRVRIDGYMGGPLVQLLKVNWALAGSCFEQLDSYGAKKVRPGESEMLSSLSSHIGITL